MTKFRTLFVFSNIVKMYINYILIDTESGEIFICKLPKSNRLKPIL